MVNNKNKLGRAYQNKNESLYGDVNSVICFLLSLCFIWIIFHYLKNVLSSKPNQISSLSSMTKVKFLLNTKSQEAK